MARRRSWLHLAVGAGLLVLLGGRWLAVSTTDALWAEALGAGAVQEGIAQLRLTLVLIAFAAAAVWCLGNLYVVYRSIGALHVPRRLGNLEFVEALPPRSLLVIVVVLGLALALLLSNGATDWWQLRALRNVTTMFDLRDPVLGRDLGFYLFQLPWRRALHEFVTIGAGLMLAVTVVLYAAVGAIRWADRAFQVTDLARIHMAGLCSVFALALYWGYRLEPLEYVAGIHDVPLDAVLLDVRLPAARLLSAIALVVALASLLCIWIRRQALVMVPWVALATVSFSAHYVVPAVSAGARSAEQRVLDTVEEARPGFLAVAYGLSPRETALEIDASGAPNVLARHAAALDAAPIWDPFAVTAFLNRTASHDSTWRFGGAVLSVYESPSGPVPVFVAGLEPDFAVAADGADRSWDARHRGTYAGVPRPVAIHAHRVQAPGVPKFVPDLSRPDSAVTAMVPVATADSVHFFAPGLNEYAVTARPSIAGVAAGGFTRRLALAWVLQSPSLLARDGITRTTRIVWHRAVADRLEQYAPFARFAHPYPVVAEGRLHWMATGYVAAEAFPLAPRVPWRERAIRALGVGLIGIVDAASGQTRVHVTPDADPLSVAWAALAPQIVRPWEELEASLRAHVRYPEELFRVQRALLVGGDAVRALDDAEGPGPDAFWWVGATPADSARRLRLVATLTDGDPLQVTGLVDGTMSGGRPTITVVRFTGATPLPNTADVTRQLSAVRSEDGMEPGQMRWVLLPEGPLAIQAFYRTPTTDEPPLLVEVAAVWGRVAARNGTLADAVRRLSLLTTMPRGEESHWIEARRWFERLDAARRSGDWDAFGEAYGALRRLLVGTEDTLP